MLPAGIGACGRAAVCLRLRKAAVYVQSVAALTGYGSLGGANASSGVVVAQKEIKVERDSSRKIKQLNVEVGQEVKSGEVLFTYDMEDMQLTIDKAKLEIEQMKNNVKDLTTQISQLEKEKKSAPPRSSSPTPCRSRHLRPTRRKRSIISPSSRRNSMP